MLFVYLHICTNLQIVFQSNATVLEILKSISGIWFMFGYVTPDFHVYLQSCLCIPYKCVFYVEKTQICNSGFITIHSPHPAWVVSCRYLLAKILTFFPLFSSDFTNISKDLYEVVFWLSSLYPLVLLLIFYFDENFVKQPLMPSLILNPNMIWIGGLVNSKVNFCLSFFFSHTVNIAATR